jgi:endonuclease YncB( thermonuclease family)
MLAFNRVFSRATIVALILIADIAFPALAFSSQPIVGKASVIDGDTIEIHGKRIRLHGIDAPEGRQPCKDATGKSYRCGQRAAFALADKIKSQTVHCDPNGKDRYRRVIAVCRLGAINLNGWMVSQGWAIAYRYYSKEFVSQEDEARKAKRGMWAGRFMRPYEWRKSQRR